MKKVLCLLLAFCLMLGMCACGGTAQGGEETKAPENTGLQVGFGRVDVTPKTPVGLGGYANNDTRKSQGFLDYVYVTCIAVTSGAETILVYTLDQGGFSNNAAESARKVITEATGIAGEKIFFGATHSHSAPSLNNSGEEGKNYNKFYYESAAEAAKQALEDRAPAQLKATAVETEKLNSVRHYVMADGSYAGANFGNVVGLIKDYAMESDRQMVLVQFDREGDKKDILMMNFQAHPTFASGKSGDPSYYYVSSDFIGVIRSKMETDTGMHFAYFTGAAGNLTPDSRIPEDKHGMDMKQYGTAIAQTALDNLAKLQPVEGTGIKTSRYMLTANINHTFDHMIKEAEEVVALNKAQGQSVANALAVQYGFSSVHHARNVTVRVKEPATGELEMNAFSIGGIGFTTGTYEMFSTSSLYVKEKSPFDLTFVITGCSGYIPNAEAFDYHSYEGDTCKYEKGTAEKLDEQYVKMLNEVK